MLNGRGPTRAGCRTWGSVEGMTAFSARLDDRCGELQARPAHASDAIIDEICRLRWDAIAGENDLLHVAGAYYYFSIQFRENLEIACRLYPDDEKLRELRHGECDTDNLSPWPGVAAAGEKLNHDEFMRRLLALQPLKGQGYLAVIGEAYLARIRDLSDTSRARSIASYEDGGLSRVFKAILRARRWEGAGPLAFKFFLEQHIRFDDDDGAGHGALSRHLRSDEDIVPLWAAFRDLLVAAVAKLAPAASGGGSAARAGQWEAC